jgi:hypothetical protein
MADVMVRHMGTVYDTTKTAMRRAQETDEP